MSDVSKPEKQKRCTKKLLCGGYLIPPSRCSLPAAINRLGELEDKLEDGRLWEAKYLEPRPHPIECCERWAEMYFEAKAKLNEYEDVIKNGGALLTPKENLLWTDFIEAHKKIAVEAYRHELKDNFGIEVPDDGQLTDQGGKQ